MSGFLRVDEVGKKETFEQQNKRHKNELEKNVQRNEELFLSLERLENENKKKKYV